MIRRALILLTLIISFVSAIAQAQNHNIVIDASSLTPVQTDALSGVAIDKIGKDTSQRPCARLKIHINRMTRAEIEDLDLRPVGGNVVVMKQQVAIEGNGLIVELTAKEPTRFHIHHDKYGDSNEVSLNLEGDKEYKLSAELIGGYTIFLSSNVQGAEVYIDDVFMGNTDDKFSLTMMDITPGNHTLKIKHLTATIEKVIDVRPDNLYFREDVNIASSRPQYVVFKVVPSNAVVVIDGKSYTPNDSGMVIQTLSNGSYNYEVHADEYHSKQGTFVVNGAKVNMSIELTPAHGWLTIPTNETSQDADIYIDNKYIGKAPITKSKVASGTHTLKVVKPMYHTIETTIEISDNQEFTYTPKLLGDYATVTVDAGANCDIYVNDELKGSSPWSGKLASGTYIIEARKEGYRSSIITQEVTASTTMQNFRLEAPTPILGTINIMSNPAFAEVYIDDKLVGETPLMYDLAASTHEVVVQMKGYRKFIQNVTIVENETLDLNITLPEGSDCNKITYVTREAELDLFDIEPQFSINVVEHTWDPATGKGVITFNEDVTVIGNNAFEKQKNLEEITIPESVTKIGDSAFEGCIHLTCVIIPKSVTEIGNNAFNRCKNLRSVFFRGTTPPTLGLKVFDECSSDLKIYAPESYIARYKSITNGANYASKIAGYTDFKAVFKEHTDYMANIDKDPNNIIRYVMRDKKFTVLLNEEWSFGANIKSHTWDPVTGNGVIIFYRNVTKIGHEIFKELNGLTSIVIPKSVTEIGNNAFLNCKGITSITIPESVKTIGDGTFSGCTALKSVGIPEGVTSIGKGAFRDCDALTAIALPNSLTSINAEAFNNCDQLTTVTFGSNMETIGASAFYNCTKLTTVTFGSNVRTIGASAFRNCDRITSITLPNSLTTIGKEAFHDCDGLISIAIPNSVTTIGNEAFYSCSNLTNITIGRGVKTIGDKAFMYCKKLTSITIPNSVTTIGVSAFYECDNLTNVSLGKSVTTIGRSAFVECKKLTHITIPEKVTWIGNYAFSGCESLTSVFCKALTPPECSYDWGGFGFDNNGRKIYVPQQSAEKYKAAEGWRSYSDAIVGYEFED